ncbi:MAG: cytochrome b/b6 domain-containing protein [Euryarchaeota archaeon]|jgi:cytochrome b561|nr:cytochrome b/b6 domain-containing protein [Euryarchaeota archaeon]MBT4925593.1 cytochrome b/b6 domain-containing protein [Euryarchaeota archaeon]MBT5735464.1 cytochrome b/b6 domain-containing protein [Euryarchaeota archaeon]
MKSHTTTAKFIHWLFIVLYVYGIFKQVNQLEDLEDNQLLLLEIIFASIFLIIVILRYSYMRRFKTFLGAREPVHIVHYYFARSVHKAMYACFILLPLTGLIIAGLYSQGYTENATPDEEQTVMDLVLDIHGAVADLSYMLILLHIAAAIYSRLKGEGVWSSMVPILKEKKASTNSTIKKISEFEEQIYDKIEKIFTSKKED